MIGVALAALALASSIPAGGLPGPLAGSDDMITVSLRVTPPVGLQTARLTCGWHASCKSPYPAGVGLDWGATDDGDRAWFRLIAYTDQSDPPVSSHIASVSLDGGSYGACSEVIARVRHANNDKLMASVRYQHIARAVPGYAHVFGNSGSPRSAFYAGMMIDESSSCPWTGRHVHAWHTDAEVAVSRNTTIPAAPAARTYSSPKTMWERKIVWKAARPSPWNGYCQTGPC